MLFLYFDSLTVMGSGVVPSLTFTLSMDDKSQKFVAWRVVRNCAHRVRHGNLIHYTDRLLLR